MSGQDVRRSNWRAYASPMGVLVFFTILAAAIRSPAQSPKADYRADVVVIVDTSISMAEPGLDPERASLLVTKLLVDLVPGKLAVIRLLDLAADANVVPTEATGQQGPCDDDPTKTCRVVTITDNTLAQIRKNKVAALIRDAQGSAAFKDSLNAHLEQKSNNSGLDLALAAAAGVFDENRATLPDTPRTLIWLSDGDVPGGSKGRALPILAELRKSGVDFRTIIFGRGQTAFSEANGLSVYRAAGPAKLVEAFTDAFRQIVQAPYKIHAPVSSRPAFEMKQHIDEAWVIVYGDRTLTEASVDSKTGSVPATFARELWPSAGAYRVAHFSMPAAGEYRVRATGGGADVTYGVVQRSSLSPYWLGPSEVISGIPFRAIAALKATGDGPVIPANEIGEPLTMTLTAGGQMFTLRDDGSGGDETAGDGKYSGMMSLTQPGVVPMALRAVNSFLDSKSSFDVKVSGHFVCPGCVISLDFGHIKAGQEVCREIKLNAEHEGAVPFELKLARALPSGHRMILRSGSRAHSPGEAPLPLAPGDAKEICLSTTRNAEGSSSKGDQWGDLAVAGRVDPNATVPMKLQWEVQPLSFWEHWGWLILLIIGILTIALIVYGYIKPNRFARELAVSFTPDYADLDDQTPMPIKQWRDVRIGFYRDARAYFHPDYRISGKPKGALALLHAGRNRSAFAKPATGHSLYRETTDAEWELVNSETGRRIGNGDVYRIGENGPHFRISARLN